MADDKKTVKDVNIASVASTQNLAEAQTVTVAAKAPAQNDNEQDRFSSVSKFWSAFKERARQALDAAQAETEVESGVTLAQNDAAKPTAVTNPVDEPATGPVETGEIRTGEIVPTASPVTLNDNVFGTFAQNATQPNTVTATTGAVETGEVESSTGPVNEPADNQVKAFKPLKPLLAQVQEPASEAESAKDPAQDRIAEFKQRVEAELAKAEAEAQAKAEAEAAKAKAEAEAQAKAEMEAAKAKAEAKAQAKAEMEAAKAKAEAKAQAKAEMEAAKAKAEAEAQAKAEMEAAKAKAEAEAQAKAEMEAAKAKAEAEAQAKAEAEAAKAEAEAQAQKEVAFIELDPNEPKIYDPKPILNNAWKANTVIFERMKGQDYGNGKMQFIDQHNQVRPALADILGKEVAEKMTKSLDSRIDDNGKLTNLGVQREDGNYYQYHRTMQVNEQGEVIHVKVDTEKLFSPAEGEAYSASQIRAAYKGSFGSVISNLSHAINSLEIPDDKKAEAKALIYSHWEIEGNIIQGEGGTILVQYMSEGKPAVAKLSDVTTIHNLNNGKVAIYDPRMQKLLDVYWTLGAEGAKNLDSDFDKILELPIEVVDAPDTEIEDGQKELEATNPLALNNNQNEAKEPVLA